MEIIVGSKLGLVGFPNSFIEELKEICSGPNPEFGAYQLLIQKNRKLKWSLKKPDERIETWEYIGGLFCVPRGLLSYISTRYPFSSINSLLSSPTANYNFVGSFRLGQREAVEALEKYNFGCLAAATAFGKTFTALALSAKLGLKTLFIVNKSVLAEQTGKEVRKILGVEPGFIGAGKFIINDFTIATIQSLTKKDLKIIRNEFGIVFVDEAHHAASSTYRKVLGELNPHRMYGLSGSFNRTDKLDWVVEQTIGPIVHTVNKQELIDNDVVLKPTIHFYDTQYKPSKNFDGFDLPAHIEDVCRDKKRNEYILDRFKNSTGKRVLLSDRVWHVEELGKALGATIYHSQLNKKDKERALEEIKDPNQMMTVATYDAIGEGFDVPLWEELWLGTPFTSPIRTIQTAGRVSRSAEGKTKCEVHDFIDIHDRLLVEKANKRKENYKLL